MIYIIFIEKIINSLLIRYQKHLSSEKHQDKQNSTIAVVWEKILSRIHTMSSDCKNGPATLSYTTADYVRLIHTISVNPNKILRPEDILNNCKKLVTSI